MTFKSQYKGNTLISLKAQSQMFNFSFSVFQNMNFLKFYNENIYT
jgi:hypothetical protein